MLRQDCVILLFSLILVLAQVFSTVLFAARPEGIALSLSAGKSCVHLGGGGLSLPRYGERVVEWGTMLQNPEGWRDGGCVVTAPPRRLGRLLSAMAGTLTRDVGRGCDRGAGGVEVRVARGEGVAHRRRAKVNV